MSLRDRVRAFLHPYALTSEEYAREVSQANMSSAGAAVTETTAMRVAAYYSCVRVLAESVASLPLELYRRDGEAKRKETTDRRYRILHAQPNAWQTSFEWRELMMNHALNRGNGYSRIIRSGDGQIRALVPLDPDRMTVEQDARFVLRYLYKLDGRSDVAFIPSEIFHLRGMTIDGVNGVSMLTWARETLGGAIAMLEHGNRIWHNSASIPLALTHPGKLSDAAYERLKANWSETYTGPVNAGRTAILEEGMDITKLAMTSVDAQFIEQRKMSRSEIAGVMRVPPHMIGDLERATFSNIEHQDLAFIKHGLRPWLVRWEQVIARDLISQNDLFAEFNVDGLARGDLKSRYEAYAIGRNWGWLSANDIRARENLNPIPNGDEYLEPLNMRPSDIPYPDSSGGTNA